MKSFKLLPLAIALAMTGIATAGASADAEVPSVVVEYGDLNLQTQAGVLKLTTEPPADRISFDVGWALAGAPATPPNPTAAQGRPSLAEMLTQMATN